MKDQISPEDAARIEADTGFRVGPQALEAADIVSSNVAAAIAAALLLVPTIRVIGPEKGAQMLQTLEQEASTSILAELDEAGILQNVH